jgi:hypothetical protein
MLTPVTLIFSGIVVLTSRKRFKVDLKTISLSDRG